MTLAWRGPMPFYLMPGLLFLGLDGPACADGHLRWSDETYRIFGLEPQSMHPGHEDVPTRIHPDDRARHNDRQDHIQDIKAEVNVLLAAQGRPIRYPSQVDPS